MSTLWLWICGLLHTSWTFSIHARKTPGLISAHSKMGNTVETNNFVKRQPLDNQNRERIDKIIEKLTSDRWSVDQDNLRYHRTQCNFMNQSWIHWQDSVAHQDLNYVYTFKVFTGPLKPTFPQRNLFQYVSRIYRCCKLRLSCPKIKGLQGTLEDGRKEIDLYVDSNIFGLSIRRAELHLEVLADEQLTVIPALSINSVMHSRFTQLRSGHVIDLALDVMFLMQALKNKEPEARADEEVTELILSLHCIHNEFTIPCNPQMVSLLHSPFIALQY